jgi:hypothetical protein
LIALLSQDLSPKGFYSGRDKFGLEAMISIWVLMGSSEWTLPGRKNKEPNFSF